jgi:hypothetical protein
MMNADELEASWKHQGESGDEARMGKGQVILKRKQIKEIKKSRGLDARHSTLV